MNTERTNAAAARYTVQRFRAGEAAPSLSLGYRASSPAGALLAHFYVYAGGVGDGTTYTVVERATGERTTFGTDDARRMARRAA